MPTDRPRRSMLYMPASNPRALEKAKSLMADTFIFDLEDAVQPDAKELARKQAVDAVNSGEYGHRELIIRANALDTPWGLDDVKAITRSKADGIVLPKVYGPSDIQNLDKLLVESGADNTLKIWAMMETPLAFLQANSIAQSSSRLAGLLVGTADLAKDLQARHTRERLPMLTALGIAVMAARAHGLVVLDGVYVHIKDHEGFQFECQQGLEFGFDGKQLIHPGQIESANEIFSPDEAEIDEARRMIAAYELALSQGKGLAVLDGRMVEELHVQVARSRVAMAEMIAAPTATGPGDSPGHP